MALLTGEQILAARDVEMERVAVPEWGGEVMVRVMEGTAKDRFEEETSGGGSEKRNVANFRARLAAACCCDEAGELIFTPQQAAALGRKSSKALDRVVTVAIRINAISAEAQKEIEGNSAGGPS